MIKNIMVSGRSLICLGAVLALTACGLATPKKIPPPPLPQFTAEVHINSAWSGRAGADTDNLYPGLQPTLHDGMLFVAAASGDVVAMDAASGDNIWRYSHDATLSGGPGAGDGLTAVGDREGMVYVHGENGELLWSKQLSSEILAAPAVGYGQVVVRTADGQLFGLAAPTGQNLWAHSSSLPALTLRGNSPPVIHKNVVIAGLDSSHLIIVDLDSGQLLWEQELGSAGGSTELERISDIDATPLVVDNNIYLASYQGRVSLVNIVTGRVVWDYTASTYNDFAADDNAVYFVDEDGVLVALSHKNAELRWFQEALRNRVLAGPAVVGDYIVCGDIDGNVHWFARSDGHLVGRNKISGAITSAPLVFNDLVIFHTRSGTLVALRPMSLDES